MDTDYMLCLEKNNNTTVRFWLGIFGSIVQSLKESFEAVVGNKHWHKEEECHRLWFSQTLAPLHALLWAAMHAGLPSNTITPS